MSPDDRSIPALLGEGQAELRRAGVESARLDARLLLQHAAGLSHADILAASRAPVASEMVSVYRALIDRRAAGAPVAHLTGEREFWGLLMETGPDALVPRPDTETLVEAALERLAPGAGRRVADLGIGTGCILAAILSERPGVTGVGVDLSADAARLAARNLARHAPDRAIVARGCWAEPLAAGRFDLVVSNPPYIETGDLAHLPAEVRRDPSLALDGGADGLAAYRALIPSARRALRRGGWLCLEIGRGQDTAVVDLLAASGFVDMETRDDLAGITRVVIGRREGT